MDVDIMPDQCVTDMAQSVTPNSSDEQVFVNEFKHDPLDRDRVCIRVIKVLPTLSEHGYIQCTMRHTDIDDAYECLSYVWGEPSSKHHRILINGRVFWIRDNLWEFLSVTVSTSRYPEFDLWIDALCIDQANVSERNHQVRHMGKIFESAVGVIAWLGNEQSIAYYMALLRDKPGLLSDPYKTYRSYDFLTQDPQVSESEALSFGYRRLCEFSYWKRAWITQEIALARRILFSIGHESIRDHRLAAISLAYSFHFGYVPNRIIESVAVHIAEPRELRGGLQKGLMELMRTFRHKECQIARDKIYSLLELSNDGHNLVPDYDASDEKVFLRTFEYLQSAWCICDLHSTADIFDKIDYHLFGEYVFEFKVDIVWLKRWSGPLQDRMRREFSRTFCIGCDYGLPDDYEYQKRTVYAICLHGLCRRTSAHLLFKISDLEEEVTVDAYVQLITGECVSYRYLPGIKVYIQGESDFSGYTIQIPLQDLFAIGVTQWLVDDTARTCPPCYESICRLKPCGLGKPLSRATLIKCLGSSYIRKLLLLSHTLYQIYDRH